MNLTIELNAPYSWYQNCSESEVIIPTDKIIFEYNSDSSRAYYSKHDKGNSTRSLIVSNNEFVKKLIHFIEKNIDNYQLSSKQICQHMGMSRSKLYYKLTELTELSLNLFIRQLRLNKAAQLLLNSDRSISEIAYDVGFADPKYFSRVFKLRFKISPRKYRKV